MGNTFKSFTFETNLISYLLKNNFIILIILLSITFSFSSCNAVKYVPESEHLLTKNTVFVNDKKTVKAEITDYIVQRPNQLVLGVPLSLNIYNLGNKNFENDFNQWKLDNPKKYKRSVNLFSEKQTRGVREFKYNTHQWFFKTGEEPSVLNNNKTKLTIKNLSQHYFNEGFFNVEVTSEDELLKGKKAKVSYLVETNKPYILDSISTSIKSEALDSIYNKTKGESILKKF